MERLNICDLTCACANLRRASRLVTKMYAEEFAATGLEITQFTLLMALHQAGEINQRQLGELLAYDSTSLTRSLKPLVASNLIRVRIGEDRRERLLTLTPEGQRLFERLSTTWEKAQAKLKAALTEAGWSKLFTALGSVERAAMDT